MVAARNQSLTEANGSEVMNPTSSISSVAEHHARQQRRQMVGEPVRSRDHDGRDDQCNPQQDSQFGGQVFPEPQRGGDDRAERALLLLEKHCAPDEEEPDDGQVAQQDVGLGDRAQAAAASAAAPLAR